MANANLSLQVLPQVPAERVYAVVDQVIAMIQASGLPYVVGPLETTIEGDLEELLGLVLKAQEICVTEGAKGVISIVKIEYSPGGASIDEKIGKYRP